VSTPQKRCGPGSVGALPEAEERNDRIRNSTALSGYRTLANDGRPAVHIGAPIHTLLARLEGVQRTDKGYRAQCPACGGTSRKLSVCEGDNGAVMMTCFSCHDTPGVLAAIGLTLADLFPERIRDESPAGRRAARQAFKQTAWGAAIRRARSGRSRTRRSRATA
jgi:hypothetical protein